VTAQIAIPSIGVAMTEALLVKWHKEPGEMVEAAEPVVEIETDKATMDLESPAAGTLGPHLYEPGAIVPVGTVIAEVVAEGETLAAATRQQPEEPQRPVSPAPASAPGETAARRPHDKSPRARRLARERESAQPDRAGRFRELIAARVAESWREIPHFAVTREVDAEPMLSALATMRAGNAEPAPTLTDLLLRALALALRERGDREDHVGLAVATSDGVVIPVVQDVLSLDAPSLADARIAAVERAKTRRLSVEDLETTPPSTLSNLGPFGIDHFTGIVAHGQTSLLTVGRAVPRVVADGDRTLSVRTTFHATLNVDHRAIDGAGAAHLLVAFARAAKLITPDF
jgi:pyruvate dehydrogenase E2 component (dihydrolipoamide acetyltransferase)